MTENAYEPIDELFAQIRLKLLKVRESDPATVEELKSLITQLEVWVESLVRDSLKLKSLERGTKTAAKSQNTHRKRPNRE